jgi:uncharacterized repeat protein (TIGR03803 family)
MKSIVLGIQMLRMLLKNPFFAFAAALVISSSSRTSAQTFTTLYNFTPLSSGFHTEGTNSGGANPTQLIVSGGTLYGACGGGGDSGEGTIFSVGTNGSGFSTLYSFTGLSVPGVNGFNDDGANPVGLVLAGTILYGTAMFGGSGPGGTVFSLNTDGSDFSVLYNLSYSLAGAFLPSGGLVLSSNTLFATTVYSDYNGVVFAINTDGSEFKILHDFSANISEGIDPDQLLLSGNSLYGLASGVLFVLKTDGTGFKILHTNTQEVGDGGDLSGLAVSNNTLYCGDGSLFRVNTDGTGFSTLFGTGGRNFIILGNVLYGTTTSGGSLGYGTVFGINTDGTGFTTLYSFTGGSDGAYPVVLTSDGNTLYGATTDGGRWSYGTIFSITSPGTPPELSITPAGTNVILTWPTNVSDFTLQSATNLGSTVVWTSYSLTPLVVNGQNTVTNPISGTQQFYRLSQ